MHELGHALVARLVGCQIKEISVHIFGGHCAWSGNPQTLHRLFIAWGGIVMQLIIFGLCMFSALIAPEFTALIPRDIWHSLTYANMFLVAINLIPIKPLDGSKCWYLFSVLKIRYLLAKERKNPSAKIASSTSSFENEETDEEETLPVREQVVARTYLH
jgi:Zn-dependent protease